MKIPTGIDIWGDTDYRGKCPHEDVELMMFVDYVKKNYQYLILLHPKNEGKRTYRQAMIDRAKGALNKGVSDLVIIRNDGILSESLFIEMKRKDHTKSVIEDSQINFLKKASIGNGACIALGHEAAINALNDWLI